MEGDGESPPFWSQFAASSSRSRRRSSSLFPSSTVLIILLPVVALLLLFFVIPQLLSLSSHLVRPNSVKKSWDSLSVLLVLCAILCGIFARRNDDGSSFEEEPNINASTASTTVLLDKSHHPVSNQWFEYSDRRIYNAPENGVSRLRRNSSSYPDLRQESMWQTGGDRRFFDDFDLNNYHSSRSDSFQRRRQREQEKDEEYLKDIPVDSYVVRSEDFPPSPETAAQPPPVHKDKLKKQTDYDTAEPEKIPSKPGPPPPPPPPPPIVCMLHPSKDRHSKSERKKRGPTKEITTALASLYNQRMRKKRLKVRNIYDNTQSPPSASSVPPPSAPPPPPPPPPPPSVFHNLFSYKKGNKSKRVHSITSSPQPPPPPPLPTSPVTSARSSKRKIQAAASMTSQMPEPPKSDSSRRQNQITAGRPPLPSRMSSYYDRDENVNSGCQSPLIPMPPPPPPPPFGMPELNFVFKGDFAKLRSTQSSRCGSPELDDVDILSTEESVMAVGADATGQAFCPSPDVNMKADTFIARLRDEWRLEKVNSMKKKQVKQTSI